ncbi:MAG: hypothetical protein ACM3ML_07915 [Micromonosporaceae bacterium]
MLPGHPFDEIGMRFSCYLLNSGARGGHRAHNSRRDVYLAELA